MIYVIKMNALYRTDHCNKIVLHSLISIINDQRIHPNTSLIEGGILSIWLFAQNRYATSVFVFSIFQIPSINSDFTPFYSYSILSVRSWERYHVFLRIFYVKHLPLFHVAAFSYVYINARYISRFLAPCDICNVRHQLNFHLEKIYIL